MDTSWWSRAWPEFSTELQNGVVNKFHNFPKLSFLFVYFDKVFDGAVGHQMDGLWWFDGYEGAVLF